MPLNIACFRFRPAGLLEEKLEAINREILVRLQEDGIAVPSSTLIDGQFSLRVAITNHRSRRSDFDALVEGVLALGRELVEELDKTS